MPRRKKTTVDALPQPVLTEIQGHLTEVKSLIGKIEWALKLRVTPKPSVVHPEKPKPPTPDVVVPTSTSDSEPNPPSSNAEPALGIPWGSKDFRILSNLVKERRTV